MNEYGAVPESRAHVTPDRGYTPLQYPPAGDIPPPGQAARRVGGSCLHSRCSGSDRTRRRVRTACLYTMARSCSRIYRSRHPPAREAGPVPRRASPQRRGGRDHRAGGVPRGAGNGVRSKAAPMSGRAPRAATVVSERMPRGSRRRRFSIASGRGGESWPAARGGSGYLHRSRRGYQPQSRPR